MPELPETETIARDLQSGVAGATIIGVSVHKSDVLRRISPAALKRRLAGARIVRCWRRAKLVVIDLSTGEHLVVQPRFTGALLIDRGALPDDERRYSTLEIRFADGRALHYRDIRRLGTVTLVPDERFALESASLGVEPLDHAFTAQHLSALFRGSTQAVKKRLMNQRVVAGIGNIYANEALWRARIDPSRAAGKLLASETEQIRDSIVGVLLEAIAARGTSFRDYRDAQGLRGGFADQLAVYGRAGLPCQRCGARLIGTHAIDGRMTVLCANCQG